jgi:hypothetical protein
MRCACYSGEIDSIRSTSYGSHLQAIDYNFSVTFFKTYLTLSFSLNFVRMKLVCFLCWCCSCLERMNVRIYGVMSLRALHIFLYRLKAARYTVNSVHFPTLLDILNRLIRVIFWPRQTQLKTIIQLNNNTDKITYVSSKQD